MPKRRWGTQTDASAAMTAHRPLSPVMHINDDIYWLVHSFILSFHRRWNATIFDVIWSVLIDPPILYIATLDSKIDFYEIVSAEYIASKPESRLFNTVFVTDSLCLLLFQQHQHQNLCSRKSDVH